MIAIRPLGPDDAERYRECRLEALKTAPTAFLATYEEEVARDLDFYRERFAKGLETGENITFGLFDGERVVGLTHLSRETRPKRRHKAWLQAVYVSEAYRSKGLAKKLLLHVIDYARSLGEIERLELSVESKNIAAKALYLSVGFVRWGIEPEFAKEGSQFFDEDCMSLRIR